VARPLSIVGTEPDDRSAWLDVMLVDGSLELDAVTISIVDETRQLHWGDRLPDGVTPAQAAL
jgi:hypothetical protein